MTRATAIARAVPVPTATSIDAARVRVRLHTSHGYIELGRADAARRDKRLTRGERAAIDNLVEAVRLLRTRNQLLGIDDAGTGVQLLLRNAEATSNGPYAEAGTIAIGAMNALVSRSKVRAAPDVLLPLDTAIHELTHVTQFARLPTNVTPNAGILEGVADAVAMLATGDDTLGEEYYRVDASGKHRGSIRDLGTHDVHGPAIGAVARTYQQATRPGVEAHEAGGLVSSFIVVLRTALGRERAERVLWAVIRDEAAWKSGGSWAALAAAFQRAGHVDDATAAAVSAALTQTGLASALR